MKEITLHVDGTHCASCKILIEEIMNDCTGIRHTFVDLKEKIVSCQIDDHTDMQNILATVNEKLATYGYIISEEKKAVEKKSHAMLWKAAPLGIVVLVLFFILQKTNLLDIGIGERVTPATSFLIGMIASVSSCLAIVGGLVLSLSAKIAADDKNNKRVFILFHVGRIVSFAFLGGMLGLLGNAIGISFTFSALLGIIASIVMIMLGLTLTGIVEKSFITLPARSFAFFNKIEHRAFAPLLIGFGTFFLPCGFTQSMQIQALSSGSFVSGAIIMLSFALGTLPMLTALSFSSLSFARSRYAPLFFKTAGVVVIGLGGFALLGGLVGLGLIDPLFNI